MRYNRARCHVPVRVLTRLHASGSFGVDFLRSDESSKASTILRVAIERPNHEVTRSEALRGPRKPKLQCRKGWCASPGVQAIVSTSGHRQALASALSSLLRDCINKILLHFTSWQRRSSVESDVDASYSSGRSDSRTNARLTGRRSFYIGKFTPFTPTRPLRLRSSSGGATTVPNPRRLILRPRTDEFGGV